MARKYDASRREEAAQRTREAILDAAFKLHGLGIVDYESLAQEANVSLATVRKHFPTREQLFQGCTAWGAAHYSVLPDFEAIAAIGDPQELLPLVVRELHKSYQSMYGQMWTAVILTPESPALARAALAAQEAARIAAGIMTRSFGLADSSAAVGSATGMLSYLTYRAMREQGGLSPAQATESVIQMLQYVLGVHGHDGKKEALTA